MKAKVAKWCVGHISPTYSHLIVNSRWFCDNQLATSPDCGVRGAGRVGTVFQVNNLHNPVEDHLFCNQILQQEVHQDQKEQDCLHCQYRKITANVSQAPSARVRLHVKV